MGSVAAGAAGAGSLAGIALPLAALAKQGRPGAVTALDIHTWVLLSLHLAVTSRKPPLSQES